jgi:DNA replication and repair protein RecF
MRDRNRLLREGRTDARWLDALEDVMAREGAAITRRRLDALDRLRAAQEGAATAFPAARLSLAAPEGEELAEADALAAAMARSRPRDFAAGRTLVGPHRTDLEAVYAAKEVPARLCSTGEQKALLVSLILANARALAAEAPLLLLLDEVAAHLDAQRRAALYSEIKALGIQCVLTGTGPELFAELGNGALHLGVTEGEGGSRVQEPPPSPSDRKG